MHQTALQIFSTVKSLGVKTIGFLPLDLSISFILCVNKVLAKFLISLFCV